MTRTFSLPSSALGYYIGTALFGADQVALVSPWMSDVDITFPVTSAVESRQTSLLRAIEQVADDTATSVYVRTDEEHNEYIRSRLPDTVPIHAIDNLHAKAVVTDDHAYVGSANITRRGLTVHRELCQIIDNEYGDVDTYLKAELDL